MATWRSSSSVTPFTTKQKCRQHMFVHAQGIVTVTDLSQEQVDGMAGGETLKAQTLAFGVVRNAKTLAKGSARLLAALQQVRRRCCLASACLPRAPPKLHLQARRTEGQGVPLPLLASFRFGPASLLAQACPGCTITHSKVGNMS